MKELKKKKKKGKVSSLSLYSSWRFKGGDL